MPFRFEFERTNRILRASIEGSIGDKDIAELRAQAAKLVSQVKPSACIVDLSSTTKYQISNASLLAMAQSGPSVPGVSIPVVIVAPAPHMFGATRVFQITSEERRPWLHVVKSPEEAYELLQVKSPTFEALPWDAEEQKKLGSQARD